MLVPLDIVQHEDRTIPRWQLTNRLVQSYPVNNRHLQVVLRPLHGLLRSLAVLGRLLHPHAATLGEGEEVAYELRSGRHAWVQLIKGSLRVNEVELRAGDGAAVSEEERLLIRAVEPSEMLLFDLA